MADRLAMFDLMIEKGSEDPFVHYARAMELRSRGRLEDALEAYGQVVTRFPDYVPTYLMAGQVAEELDREDAARKYLTLGIEAARQANDSHAEAELEAALEAL